MGQLDRARKHLDDRLEPGEECLAAVQFLKPGSAASFATLGAAGIAGLIGAMALTGLSGRGAPNPDQLDPEKQIDITKAHLGQLTFTDRRLFVVPLHPDKVEIVEVPLAGATVSIADKGRLAWAARTFLVTAPDGRWFIGEVQTMFPKKKSVERFSSELERALAAAPDN
jgi:hypothetical protein